MASDLLKPDPITAPEDAPEDEDDDLEALRMAALNSIKPKKPSFTRQNHPSRTNLVSIVPVDENAKDDKASSPPPTTAPMSPQNGGKFERMAREKSEEESEYEEYSEYLSETDEEAEAEEKLKEEEMKKKKEEKVEKKTEEEPDDVLKLDCTDEVEELLKEFEDDVGGDGKDEKKERPKKRKKVRVVKRRKKQKAPPSENVDPNSSHKSASSQEGRGRSPRPYSPSRRGFSPRRDRPLSPSYRYRSPPPYYGRYPSPGRPRSPYYRPSRYGSPRRYRSPSPRGYRRSPPPPPLRWSPSRRSPPPRSRSPYSYRHRSPLPPRYRDKSPGRRSPPPRPDEQRGGSAPRFGKGGRGSQERKRTVSPKKTDDMSKSKSLPPQQKGAKVQGKKETPEAKEEREFQERLKKMSSPEREKALARRRKFAAPVAADAEAKKVISLKAAKSQNVKRMVSEEDAISLSVDDTMDMFDAREAKPTELRDKIKSRKGNKNVSF